MMTILFNEVTVQETNISGFFIMTINAGFSFIFTGRNEVVAKVIFLHLPILHSVHGGGGGMSASVHAGIPPLGSRHLPEQTPPEQTPPPPPRKKTPAYGQRVAGTHPTGMHSCFTSVCQEFCPQGRGVSANIHPRADNPQHPSRRLLLRTVRILLECILVSG